MKIIHLVLGKGNPNRMNGVNKVAYQLATTQTEMGHDVTLWGIANNLDLNYPERNFKTVLFQQTKNKLKLDAYLKKAIAKLSEDAIVHIHGSFIPEFFHVSKLLSKRKISFIYTPHGALTKGAMAKNNFVKKMYFQLFESTIIKNAKAMQLLGVQELEFTNDLIHTNNKVLIPNGQDLSVIPDLETVKNKKIVFGFCGRLATFHKGLDLLFRGFKLYLENGGEGTLELIGDSDEREMLENLCGKLGIRNHVIFHGKQFGEEKFKLIGGFDVFMHTSRMEGFPTAVLEAAAMGKVCITSEATNINDYFRKFNAGLPMENNNVKTIAKKMSEASRLFRQQKLQSIGNRAKEMVQKEFNWTHVSKQLIDVYSK